MPNEMTVSEKRIVDEILSQYPTLKRIIHRNPLLYRKYIDQYSGAIPALRFEEIAEFSLGGIILGSQSSRQFANQLNQLETWLSVHNEYATGGFGDKLVTNFFNYYSEIEVFDALRRAGCYTIDRDIPIGQGNENLDFSIFIRGKAILIEVVTPRMSLEIESWFGSDPGQQTAGFFDNERGIQRLPETPYTRVQAIIEKEIQKHFSNVDASFQRPVILIINFLYAYPEIVSNLRFLMETNPPLFFHGILMYKDGRSEFNPNPRFSLTENEITFFNRLL
jgi:hypothetical protein